MAGEVTPEFLVRFAAAWNKHDCDALLAMVTDDCVFETAIGQHAYGDRHTGKAELREAFPKVWETFPNARWEEDTHVVCGDRGFSQWTFRGTDRAGKSVEVRGVDVFTFRDGRISRKDTFRKSRST
jgi:steroid delta-isomerase-like uncharacterized protein